ncbi:hypothetical protein RSK20926_17722 [Roseobacter sp. SK209-2-6]|uniref:hypothetical protein n=1 Tax=Roseobacter sp. SK209-2-6 TaxID=388739 RepID=UPI0000F3F7F0|nr:hypothetical protein [Roseobacter sp. SK209-2-6]EBA17601.1 hypothetical protein RSK20926_17722 [Roseobacter sp. SK209-2-6]
MKSLVAATALAIVAMPAFAEPGAYLQITVAIENENRAAAAAVYFDYKEPFLTTIDGAEQKSLLVRMDDIQVLHGFDTVENAAAYLESGMFQEDIVTKLSPLFAGEPEIRIFEAN